MAAIRRGYTNPQRHGDRRHGYISRAEGRQMFDRGARKYLGMSGEEFSRRYRSGEIPNPDRPEVVRVSMLMEMAES